MKGEEVLGKAEEGKIEVGSEVINAGLENLGGEKQHRKEGIQMLATNENIPTASGENIEAKAADNSSDESSTSIETSSESEFSDSNPTKRGFKRKRNHYRNKKWIITQALNGNEVLRQSIVAKRKLIKVKQSWVEKPSQIEKGDSDQEKGSGDMLTKVVSENETGQGQNVNKKVEKKFWKNGLILRAFGCRKNESLPVVMPGPNLPQGLKPLVHNSGIIRRKLERLRSMVGIYRPERVEPLNIEVAERSLEEIDSKNSDFTSGLVSSNLKTGELKNEEFAVLGTGKIDCKSDLLDIGHNASKVQPKSKVSSLLPFLSAFNGKISVDPPDIVEGGKIKGKSIDKPLPIPLISLRQRADVETWISGGQPCRVTIAPYLAHYPYWAGMQFVQEPLIKPPYINKRISGANDSGLFMPLDPVVSSKKKIVKNSVPSWLNSIIGSRRAKDGGNVDCISINNSIFSYVDSDLVEKESSDGKETRFSSITKRLQGWGSSLRGRLNRRGSGSLNANSAITVSPDSGQPEQPEASSAAENQPNSKKRIRGKMKINDIAIPLRLTISVFGRSIYLGHRGHMEEKGDQSISGDDKKLKKQGRKD